MSRFLLSLLFLGVSLASFAQPGKLGNITITSQNTVVNTYSRITIDVPVGASTITVNSIDSDLGSLATGDLIMLYQAQGALIQTTNNNNYGTVLDYNGAGNYEFVYVASVSGNSISLSCKTSNSYSVNGRSQVVKVPLYNNLTVNANASIIPKKWDGASGGITVIHVKNILTNNGTITSAFAGFRGGKRDNLSSSANSGIITTYRSPAMTDGAEKGESIVGYGADYDAAGMGGRYGRGAPANGGGGGNGHNAAGGGGANGDNGNTWTGAGVMDPDPRYTAAWAFDPDYISNGNQLTNSSGGGRGGYTYAANDMDAFTTPLSNSAWGGDHRDPVGGRGGRPLSSDVQKRIFFGGGGGAGDGNNNASNDGGDGGGIVYIIATVFNGIGNVASQGMNGLNTIPGHNDAPGGGGGGGTIVVKSFGFTGQTLNANGGAGGNQLITGNESEGCGGGGGGGFIAVPTGATGSCGISNSYTYIYGTNGTSTSASVTEFPPNGGTWGAQGQNNVPVSPYFIPYTLACIIDGDADNVHDPVIDLDDDNDGIADVDESVNGVDPSADENNNGAPNYADPTFVPYLDSNCDGINDYFDFDLDSIPDFLDADSDNDGIPDTIEAGGADANRDGVIDNFIDVDGNGLSDQLGAGLKVVDVDGDGLPAFRDRDSDGDGIYDIIEAGGVDANNDGIVDAFTDEDKDGYADAIDPTTDRLALTASNASGKTPLPIPDTDGDGKLNYLDIDSDNDGIPDNIEAQSTAGYRAPVNQDTDGDGIADVYDLSTGGTPIVLVNTDGTDAYDYLDTDSDNDGVPDAIEGHDEDADGNPFPALPVTGDSDNDGLFDGYDLVNGFNNTTAGMGGNGARAPLQDTDGDGIRDWRDQDDDGDCILTSATGVNGENTNANGTWADDFSQGGVPKPNYLFPTNNLTVTGASRCGDGTVSLTASSTGSGIFRWYTAASGGVLLRTSPSVSTDTYTTNTLAATTTFFVEFDNGTCVTTRKAVVASVVTALSTPTVTSASRCQAGTLTLSATSGVSGTFTWYDAASGGNLLSSTSNATSSNFTTPSLNSTTTYYVEFNNGSCITARAAVIASITGLPTLTVTDANTCGNSTVTLQASAAATGTFNWYATPSSTIILSSTSGASVSNFTTPSLSATTIYYVEYNNGSCTSIRTPVTATFTSAIAAPSVTGQTLCTAGSVTLSASYASSGTFRWYNVATGGAPLSTEVGVTSSTFTTPNLTTDTNYFVEFFNGTCTSARTRVTGIIISGSLTTISASRCGTGTVTLVASSSVAGTFRWYDNADALVYTSSSGITTSSFTTPSLSSTTTYTVEVQTTAPACTSPRASATATIAPAVTLAGTNASVCAPGTVTLSASSGGVTGTFRWYSSSVGGTLLLTTTSATSSTFTTPFISETTDYYVEFDQGTCVTARIPVRAGIINTTDIAVTETSRCGEGTVQLLAASNIAGTFRWFDVPSGGTALSASGSGAQSNTFTTPNLTATTTYYVQLSTGTPACTSARVPVVATVLPDAVAPVNIDGSRCGTGSVTIAASSAVSGTIRWYDASSGGNLLQTNNTTTLSTFITPSINADRNYFAEYSNGFCTSARTTVLAKVTTGTAPAAPMASGALRCGAGTVTLTATSASSGVFRWYSAATGGTLLQTTPAATSSSFTTPSLTTSTTYHVEFDNGTCLSSARTAVTATINTPPAQPSTTSAERCGSGSVTLSASAATSGTFRWYDAATGGNLIHTTAAATTSSYSPSVLTTTSYFVEFDNGTCTSASRSQVTATVNTIPSAPVDVPASACGPNSVTLGATSSISGTFTWFDAASGGNLLSTSTNTSSATYITPVISANTTYHVAFSNGVCTSARTPVVATIQIAPAAPAVTPASLCGPGTLTLSASSLTNGTIEWYATAVGGALLKSDVGVTTSSFTTPSLSATQQYFVSFNNGTCSSARVAVNATINPQPSITGATPGCAGIAGNGTIVINATVSSGTLEYSINGTTYQASPTFTGLANNTYTVYAREVNALCSASLNNVTVACNRPPVVSNKTNTTNEDTAVSGSVLGAGDNDPDGTILVVNTTPVSGPVNGVIVLNSNGSYTYTPHTNYNGADIITFTVCDSGTPLPSACIDRTLTITINPVNDPPVAANDNATTNEDTPVTFNIAANDTDVDGTIDASTIDLDPSTPGVQKTITNASGTWTVLNNGDLTYTPSLNFNGPASITYTVNDNNGATSDAATVLVNVISVNDPPVAGNDLGNTNPNTAVLINIVTNDTDVDGNVVAASVDLDPSTAGVQKTITTAAGTWTVSNIGELTYTPALNFAGPASITYTINDDGGATSNIATVTINVNHPPVAVDDNATTAEDTPVTFNIVTNDTDADGTVDASSVDLDPSTPGVQTSITNASGTWTVSNTGALTYTPLLNFNGPATVTYTVSDNNGVRSAVGTVTVNVTLVNDPPVAANDNATTNEDTPVTFNIAANDTDVDGTINASTIDLDPSTPGVQKTITNASGTWTVLNNGDLTYTPLLNFNGPASITYTVNDNNGATSDAATVLVNVISVNDPPVAGNDLGNTNPNTTVLVNIVSNDTDVDGNVVAASVDLDPSTAGVQKTITTAAGTWTVSNIGELTYTPALNFAGPASITYTVNDDSGATSNIATVTINVNHPPVAVDDNATTAEDTPVTFNIVANDTDADGTVDASSVDLDPSTPGVQTSITNASGTWTVSNTGALTYTPLLNFNGPATVTYTVSDNNGVRSAVGTVTVNVTSVNDPPVAANDNATTNEDTPVTFNIAANDTDVDGTIDASTIDLDPSTPGVQKTITNASGTWTVLNNGDLTYTPSLDFNGPASITYTVNDNNGATSDAATVSVNVISVNDPPVAVDDNANTNEDTPVVFDIIANDTDDNGALDLSSIDLDPSTAGDAKLITNAFGVWSVDGAGLLTFTPAANVTGMATLTYTIRDVESAVSNIATIFIDIFPVNDAPLAQDDNTSTNQGVAVTLNVLTNDSDIEGALDPSTVDLDPLTPGIQQTITTIEGLWTVNASGHVTFAPTASFRGTASLTYTVQDTDGATSNIAIITIIVIPSNDPPVLVNLLFTTEEDVPVSGSVLDPGDSDPENTALVVTTTPVSIPTHGTVVISSDGTFTYTPTLNYFGTDMFSVEICDSGSPKACATKSITITVTPVNDGPIVNDDANTTTVGVPVSGTLATNDSDVDGTLTYNTTPVQGPTNGTIVINTNGTYTYTPNPGFLGTDVITIQVCDNGTPVICATEILTIEVQPVVPIPPVAIADATETKAGTPVTINILLNDVPGNSPIDPSTVDLDPNSAGLQQSIVIPGKGTVTVDANGVVQFTPANGFSGDVEFTYTVKDQNGMESNVVTVAISVKPNLPPGVVIPNAFSPNNDGDNDYFIIEGADQHTVVLYVYNRWGNIVFADKNYKNTWAGTGSNAQDPSNKTKITTGTSETELPAGTYFYVVEFPDRNASRSTGFIELRR